LASLCRPPPCLTYALNSTSTVWRMAIGGADAVHSAAGDQSTYASGVAYERISIDPNRMRGLPCIRDTRVTVSAVPGQLAASSSLERSDSQADSAGSIPVARSSLLGPQGGAVQPSAAALRP
jgi:hypothetical protein